MAGKKIKYISYVRALCMLWIVGFWHLGGKSAFAYSNIVTLLFTKGILATFSYISGRLYANRIIGGKKEAIAFYKKRLTKVYPLFWTSATLFYILHLFDTQFWHITSFRQYAMSILGIACIFPPAPGTVWFIDMLLLFWGITPIILAFKDIFKRGLMGGVLYMGFSFLVMCGGDDRLLLYLPIYILGLLSVDDHRHKTGERYILFPAVLLAFIALCALYVRADNKLKIYFIEVICGGVVTYAMIAVGKIMEALINSHQVNGLDKLMGWLSSISMTAYLFHDQIEGILFNIIGRFSIWEAYGFVLPITLIMSWAIQWLYGQAVSWLKHSLWMR